MWRSPQARSVLPAGAFRLHQSPHIEGVITISITAEALAAIASTLPNDRQADRRPDGNGGFLITLPHGLANRLKVLRYPGESYSDVILRPAGELA